MYGGFETIQLAASEMTSFVTSAEITVTLSETPQSSAFCFETSRATGEISARKTDASSMYLARLIPIQPLPQHRSYINGFFWLLSLLITASTKISVSARGIRTPFLTLKRSDINSHSPTTY